jgi:hypothetical protein
LGGLWRRDYEEGDMDRVYEWVAMTGGRVKKGVAKRRGYEGLNVGLNK